MKLFSSVPVLLILPILMVAHLPSLAEEWEAILTATSSNTGVEAQKLVFKTVAESTSGFDAGKDIPAPPKAPAPVKLDAFFPVAGNRRKTFPPTLFW